MSKKTYAVIFLASFLFYILVSFVQKTPGYMDAAYYYTVGKQIAAGYGWYEPFIWNYLSSPTSIPTYSFTYWMPLPAIISAAGMFALKSTTFWSSRLFYILLASFVPIINTWFTYRYSNNRLLLWMSALMGVLSGFYLQYFTITDSFIPYMIFGSLYLLLLQTIFIKGGNVKWYIWGGLGILAGLLHLCRADGILWLFAGFIVIAALTIKNKSWVQIVNGIPYSFFYLLLMSPWYLRNLSVFHSLFVSGSGLTIYFTKYNDLFSTHPEKITLLNFIRSNPESVILNRVSALKMNLESLIGISGGIVLFPFTIVGVISRKKETITKFVISMLAALFIVMTFVFPFAGSRGGFIHSASSLQCYFWSITPIGFEIIIKKVAKYRKWKPERSLVLLGTTLIAVLALITTGLFLGKIVGENNNSSWDAKYMSYVKLNQFLTKYSNDKSPVMINDSPGFYAMTGRSSIQLTVGSLVDTKKTMNKFGSKILVLDEDRSSEYDSLYSAQILSDDFTYLGKLDDYVIYQLTQE